jgi:NAD(P)-dependent dehydrogenase (short-subunit alcohol dehydrogenase family)
MEMTGIRGRVALVTGAGRGIGRAIALALAAEGARVALSARTRSEIDEAARAIQAAGGEALAFEADLADRNVPAELAARVRRDLGPIDILVNNAGVGSSSNPKPVVDFDDDFWDLSVAVNMTAPYLLSKAVLPGMLERKHGRILTVASINSRRGSFHGAAYAASKHGVLGLMRTLAMETASEGITVNCICPGPVESLMNDKRLEYDAARLGRDLGEHTRLQTPIGGRLVPDDIAPMAVYLASDAARMITGQAYNLCGGLLMS